MGFLDNNTFGGGAFGPFVRLDLNKPVRAHTLLAQGETPLQTWNHRVSVAVEKEKEDGTTFMSTNYTVILCIGGRSGCILCAKNAAFEQEAGGEVKNSEKPFPMTPQWYMNVWNFITGRVEVLRGGSTLFQAIELAFDANSGSLDNVDLQVQKSGKGGKLDTNYSAVPISPPQAIPIPMEQIVLHNLQDLIKKEVKSPSAIEAFLATGAYTDFDPKELEEGGAPPQTAAAPPPPVGATPSFSAPPQKVGAGAPPDAYQKSQTPQAALTPASTQPTVVATTPQTPPPTPAPAVAPQDNDVLKKAQAVVVNFGKYKGKTIGEIAQLDQKYLGFLSTCQKPEVRDPAKIVVGAGSAVQAPPATPAPATTPPPAPTPAPGAPVDRNVLQADVHQLVNNSPLAKDFQKVMDLFKEVTATEENKAGVMDIALMSVEQLQALKAKLSA